MITSIIFLLPFKSVTPRDMYMWLHYLTFQIARGTERDLVTPGHGSNPHCSSAAEAHKLWAHFVITHRIVPCGMQHKSSSFLKTCQLEVSQCRACRQETGTCCTRASSPSASADTGVCVGRACGELGPVPQALQQCGAFFPSQQLELHGARTAVSCPFALQHIRKRKKKKKVHF